MKGALHTTPSDREKVLALEEKVQSLEQQLDWFKRQLFGRKSEKRQVEDCPEQPLLNGFEVAPPPALWPGSIADVSFVAGLLVEKFVYHQPLYRQHQRLSRDGIELARGTLTNLAHRAIALLEPVFQAQLRNVLRSKVLAIDETPIKAGREKKGKMRLAWYWPIYGQDDEVVFTYSRSRGHKHLLATLGEFNGTLLSDGHSAYRTYAARRPGVVHAQCWTHTRREFVKAENIEPEPVAEALDLIGVLYQVEAYARKKRYNLADILACRAEHSKPAVDAFFTWCDTQCQRMDLVPSNPLSKALKYAQEREEPLRLFLADPELPIDTNHVERTLRVIPMGRKSWLFCWTEVGAERVGIIQSLLTTCRLHDIHPYTYLVDVLQRIASHPAKQVEELTPRRWKSLHADNPLRSDLEIEYGPV